MLSWLAHLFKKSKKSNFNESSKSAEPSPHTNNEAKRTPQDEQLRNALLDQALIAMEQLNESLQLAHNSTKPATKVSRLEFSKSKLEELQLLARQCPGMFLTNEDEVKATILRMEDEFSKAGYYSQADASLRSYKSAYVEAASSNADIVKGFRLSATMQLRTPLRILEMHGLEWPLEKGDPPLLELHEGTWVPVTKSFQELGLDIPEFSYEKTMASDIGPINADGGDYLIFLKSVRQIVESKTSIEARRTQLRREIAESKWQLFCQRLGGREAVSDYFFPPFIDCIPKLTGETLQALWERGLVTAAKIETATDEELLSIKGIGPAKLKLIRQTCAMSNSKEAEWVDALDTR